LEIVQGGFFLRKKPLGFEVPVKSRIENAVEPVINFRVDGRCVEQGMEVYDGLENAVYEYGCSGSDFSAGTAGQVIPEEWPQERHEGVRAPARL
jgi:hypothetical protein